MRPHAIAAAILLIALPAAAEDIQPLVADPSAEPPPAKVSTAHRALDLQRRAQPSVGTAQDMTGEEARRLSERRAGRDQAAGRTPSPMQQR